MAATSILSRPQRWDRPFGGEAMPDEDIDRVLGLELFRDIDPEQFPAGFALREIIRNDSRIVRFRRGDIIVREGDYGNSLFVIMKGSVRVVVEHLPDRRLGYQATQSKGSLLGSLSQLWTNPSMPEVRDTASYQASAEVNLRGERDKAQTFLKNVDGFIAAHRTERLGEEQAFGEIAALARTPRTATVFADGDVTALEMRWQGLRELRRRDRQVRDHIDALYRSRRLLNQLSESPLFGHLDEATLKTIAQRTLFESHGEFEWFTSFKRAASDDPGSIVGQEPLIAEQGAYLDGLLLICSGFARVSRHLDHGEQTVAVLSTDDVYGLEEILRHRRDGTPLLLAHSLRAVGYVDLLRIPTGLIEEHVLPALPPERFPAALSLQSDPAERAEEGRAGPSSPLLDQALFDFFVDNRIVNGTATMLIDLERCTGCDDCVRACAAAHDNNPRFIRHGRTHDKYQVAHACMHCTDPVCLIGCPTGAIARNFADGRVMIDDKICIGCSTCANSCPYNNIQMVEIRDRDGAFVTDQETKAPIVKATKCDLCYGQLGGPACQRACPHDALIRIDMHDLTTLAKWAQR